MGVTLQPAGQQQAARSSNAVQIAVILVVVVVVGGLVWFTVNEWTAQGTGPAPKVEIQDDAATTRLNIAINRCDSSARAQLYLPNTMEYVGNAEWYSNDVGGFVIQREIAAKDKNGIRYRYRYFCAAMADGRGGIGEVSAVLLATNK